MATMKDVAQKAGVGVGTVSRVINHVPGVKESTLNKVNEAIKALNYIPDAYARGLKTKSSRTIALIVSSVWYPFFSEFAYYVEKRLDKEDYKLLLCNSDNNPVEEAKYIKMLKQNKIDAIIAITYSDIEQYIYSNIPFVSLDRYFDKKVSYVTSDNYEGGKLAAQKLIEKGAETLIYIGEKVIYSDAMSARKSGFVDYCNLNHVPYEIVEVSSIKNYENVKKDILSFLEENYNRILKGKIGCFTSTDDYGYLLLNASNSLKISVPENLQIIGFDGGKRIISEMPTMSSIRQPVDLIAKESVQLLTKLINKETNEISRVYLPISFYEGDTTC